MKKILISISIIGVAAALGIGATVAYFQDTETSQGNIFVAGSMNLRVDSFDVTRNGKPIGGTGWFPPRDLANEKFFQFGDVKPGDWFGRTLSLHIDDNPAWICLSGANLQDDGNGLQDPEQEAGDPSDGNGQGELSQNLHILAWLDKDADGQHDKNEPFIVDSFFDVFVSLPAWPVRDSSTGTGPLDPSIPIELVQLDLCGGNHIVDPISGAVSCGGTNMGNKAQGDSLSADLILYAEQHRNNLNFRCNPPPHGPPGPGTT